MSLNNKEPIELVFLGSGGPFTLPQFFCRCEVCVAARKNPLQRRTRASVAIIGEEVTLIDAGPDLEMQLEREGIHRIDNIFITHWHYDHIAGLGSVGYPQVMNGWNPIDVFVPKNLVTHFDKELAFLKERIALHPIVPSDVKLLPDAEWEVVKTEHTMDSVGFIINSEKKVAYLVDTALPPNDTTLRIKDVDLLIVDAMFDSLDTEWRHFTVQGAIDYWQSIGIPECILTHLSCHRWENHQWLAGLSHTERIELEKDNPGMRFAYDGMRVQI
jgi:phosphoribosyl 1,2-cyclic phosphate phosphodiesterase